MDPGLASDDRPAFVVVFEGETKVLVASQPNVLGFRSYNDVICVLDADGRQNVYADVSREGIRVP